MTQPPHAPTITPREVFARLRELARRNDREGIAELLAPDGVVEWQFDATGAPRRVEGREAFRQFVRASRLGSLIRFDDLRPLAIHDTGDPDVLVVETATMGTVLATGRQVSLPAVAVLTVRHGEIVHWRDYVDPLAGARATGGLRRLLAAVSRDEEEDEASPRRVFGRGQERLRELDASGFADLFAADGVMEYPFAPAGTPRRLEGREAVREYLTAGVEGLRRSGRRIGGPSRVVVHETLDPEVIVAELLQEDEDGATGQRRGVPMVQVVRVRDGEIVSFRDYIDYAALAAV